MSGINVARENKEKEEEEKGWSDLPWDLLESIVSRFCAGVHAVRKSWGSIITQPVPHTMQIDGHDLSLINKIDDPQLRNNIPYLMNLNRKTGLFHFRHPITNDAYMVDLPELAGEEIRFSNDGWLLVCGCPKSVFFFHPFTRTRIQVPEIPLPCAFQSMYFSCPPTLSGCTVFGVLDIYCKEVLVGTLRHGGEKETWSIQRFQSNKDFLLSKCCPVLRNGLYYCLGRGGNLGIFDPQNNTWNVLGESQDHLKKCRQSFLLESDGDIFGVFVANNGRKIKVLRLQEKSSELTWHEVKSLEDKMFYVCYGSSHSIKPAIQGAENKICLPRFYDNENLFYSLGSRQYHSFLGNFSKKNLLDTKEMTHGIWINMPSIQENEMVGVQ